LRRKIRRRGIVVADESVGVKHLQRQAGVAKKFCDKVQPPKAPSTNLLENLKGVFHTYEALKDLRIS